MAAWSGSLFHFFHYFHFIHYKGIKPCSWNRGSMINFLKLAKKNTTRTKLQIIFSDNQSAWKRWDWNRNKLLYEYINKPGTENWVDVNITLMSLKPDLYTIWLISTLGHWFNHTVQCLYRRKTFYTRKWTAVWPTHITAIIIQLNSLISAMVQMVSVPIKIFSAPRENMNEPY